MYGVCKKYLGKLSLIDTFDRYTYNKMNVSLF